MRRVLALLVSLAAIAALVAGCGKSSSAGSGFDQALGYVPKNAGVVVALKTDPKDPQFKNLNALADKFPFAGTLKDRLRAGVEAGGTSYDKDIKPLLGNDAVIAIPPSGLKGGQGSTPFILAWKMAGGDIEKLLAKGNHKIGESNGATLYQGASTFYAVKDNTLVASKDRAVLDSALQTKSAGSGLKEADFNAALGGLSTSALARVEGNFQAIFAANPNSAQALKVPWVKGLRTFGATAQSASDGISVDFDVKTQGVSAADQPLATGAAAAPLVKRPGEVGAALRNPGQLVHFAENAASATNPKSLLSGAKVAKQLGIDINKDVVDQLTGNSVGSFALDGSVAARADLKDPAAFKTTLAKIMKNLPKAQRAQGKPVSTVKQSGGLYTVSHPGGKPATVGVIGKVLVVATDPGRAKEIAAQPANAEPGTKGALAFAADPRALVAAALKRSGNSGAAALIGPALSAHLDNIAGSVEAEADGLRGSFKLTIK